MSLLGDLYRPSLALLTDLYQLTMAYGYWRSERADDRAVFHLYFRNHPFNGNYAVCAGLATVLEYLQRYRFEREDLDYLAELQGNDGQPLFQREFLEYLATVEPGIDVHAVPEGTLVFAGEPMLRVEGPLLVCQLLETPLLNIVNYQTLIATKAARIRRAAGEDQVLEFGLRRAQGFDGAISASRAAYIGGADATSNVLAGRLLGIPVRGTHAHSWVMSFDDEAQAFRAYADAMPNNCVFLVDTYDTAAGVDHAIAEGRALRERGFEMVGIRLDSGDLASLSTMARSKLDEAGFPGTAIVASNDLDEGRIGALKRAGAAIAVWGVGTRLVTAHDDPALGGVYKLAAIRQGEGDWQYRVKLSDDIAKASLPGRLQVRRYLDGDAYVGDLVYNDLKAAGPETQGADFASAYKPAGDLLVPAWRGGRSVYDAPPLRVVKSRLGEEMARFEWIMAGEMAYPAVPDAGVRRLREELTRELR